MDPLLLEAMREVDAMLPGTPPIAPSVADDVTHGRASLHTAIMRLGYVAFDAGRQEYVCLNGLRVSAEAVELWGVEAFARARRARP